MGDTYVFMPNGCTVKDGVVYFVETRVSNLSTGALAMYDISSEEFAIDMQVLTVSCDGLVSTDRYMFATNNAGGQLLVLDLDEDDGVFEVVVDGLTNPADLCLGPDGILALPSLSAGPIYFVSYADNDGELDYATVVDTEYGPIRGSLTLSGTRFFTSIPYAMPPIGEYRFANPVDPEPWNETLDTVSDPPGCMQYCASTGVFCPVVKSEDCLYLNVFTPYPLENNTLLPVNVYFHGGGFRIGHSGPFKVFNATNMVSNNDVIVVTINYRLHVFGFLYDEDNGIAGNFGLRDVIKALRWVNTNIEAFGGDNGKVTLFGNSVGSATVSILSTCGDEEIYDMFQGAAMMSNPMFGIPLRTPDSYAPIAQGIVNSNDTGCSDADDVFTCLRDDVNADTLLDVANSVMVAAKYDEGQMIYSAVQWTPILDGDLISKQPLRAFESGDFHPTARLLMGYSTDETRSITFSTFSNLDRTYEALQGYASTLLGVEAATMIFEEYGEPANVSDVRDPPYASLLTTAGRYVCPTYYAALKAAEYRANDSSLANSIYHVNYNHMNSLASGNCEGYVCHNSEVYILWATDERLTDDEYVLSAEMQSYWTGLVDLDDADKSFNTDTQNTIVFTNGTSISVMQGLNEADCEVWGEIGYRWLPELTPSPIADSDDGSDDGSDDDSDEADEAVPRFGLYVSVHFFAIFLGCMHLF